MKKLQLIPLLLLVFSIPLFFPNAAFTAPLNPNIDRPFVVRSTPGDGERGIPVNSQIRVMFNRQMDYLTFNKASIMLMDKVGGMVEGVISYDSRSYTMTFTPSTNLARGEEYVLFIPAYLIRDIDGNAPVENISLSFSAAEGKTDVPALYANPKNPKVLRTFPDVKATDVAIDTTITFNMSLALARDTVTADCLVLNDGTQDLACKVFYSEQDKQIIALPEQKLSAGKVYHVILKNSFRSKLGFSMLTNHVTSFSTRTARDDTPPIVVETSPIEGGVNVSVNSRIVVTFSEAMDPLSITNRSFLVLDGNAPVDGKILYDLRTRKAMFVPLKRLLHGRRYSCLVTEKVKDNTGNSMRASVEWTFATRQLETVVLPTIIKTTPNNGEKQVSPDTKILVHFNKAMSEATANPFNLSLEDAKGPMPITTGFIKGGNFVTIIPGRELEYSTVYTVKIGPGMSDPEGNRLKSEFSFAFTTAPKPDLTPPAVSRVEPREDSAQVLIDAPVRVYLTEPVDPASLDENSLLIRDSKGTILPGKMHYQRQDMMLEFLGKGPFEYKNIYTAELRAGLSDMAGNRLNSAKIWKFSTVNPPDRNAPRIISTHPFEGEKSVSVATTVKVFLSETVAPACFDQKPVELFDLQGVVEKSSLNWDSTLKAFILSPDRHLKHGQEYRVVVSKKIHDPAGNHLGESLIYSFFTELPPDHVRPELVSCSPLPETRDVEPNQIIRLTFTESLKPVTVNVDTAYLETCDNQKIPCQVDFLEGKFMITLRPLQNMPWDTDMRVFVSRKVTDPSGNPLASTVVVPFRTRPAPDTIAPTLVKSNPSHGAGGVSVDASLRLYFSEPLSDRHLHEDTISLITTGIDENRVVECRISWVPDGNTLVVTPARRLNFEREYKLQVTSFQDLAGNKNKENLSLVFRTETAPDREPPRVVFSLPSSDGDVISHKDQIRVRFSEPLLLESINGASVDLRDLEGTLAANVDWNGADNTLLVKPDHGLKPGREYFLRVGSGIQDLFRNNLANPLRIHFSTREIEDRIPPKVVKIYPANGAVKVSETQKIRAIFSEKIDIRSVNRHTVILEDEGERMATHLQLNDEGQLDIRPTESLRSGRQYRVTLTEGICDSKGNALKTPLSWAFIVGVSEVDRELKIVSLTPHEGMKNVNPAARIAVRFNNPIDPASLNPYTFIVMKNGRRIKGDVTLTEDGREAVFNVSGQLTPGVEYMVRLTEGVRNQFARSLKRSKEWAFTTSGEKVMSKK